MAEKVYLTADQYVVKCLEEKDQEIAKLNEKYDELLARFVKLQAENRKFEQFKSNFECKITTSKNGYEINYNPTHGNYGQTVMYSWELDPEKQDSKFQDLLNALGLKLPKLEETEKEEN